jgi:hypothetical protein
MDIGGTEPIFRRRKQEAGSREDGGGRRQEGGESEGKSHRDTKTQVFFIRP